MSAIRRSATTFQMSAIRRSAITLPESGSWCSALRA